MEISEFIVRSGMDYAYGVRKKLRSMGVPTHYLRASCQRRSRSQTGTNVSAMLARPRSSNSENLPLQISTSIRLIERTRITRCLAHPVCLESMLVLTFHHALNVERTPLNSCIQTSQKRTSSPLGGGSMSSPSQMTQPTTGPYLFLQIRRHRQC